MAWPVMRINMASLMIPNFGRGDFDFIDPRAVFGNKKQFADEVQCVLFLMARASLLNRRH